MKYITVKPNSSGLAGIGHQWLNWLVPYILAKKYGLKFVHQNFVGENDGIHASPGSNAYQNMAPVKLWNDFLNFGEGELTFYDLPEYMLRNSLPHIQQEEATYDHQLFKSILEKKCDYNVLHCVSEHGDGQFLHIDWDFYRNNDLKIKYNNSKRVKNFKCYFDKDCINVAVHIRRGDVTENKQFKRWINLNYYLKIMENLANINELKNIIFHVYSWDMSKKEKDELFLHCCFGKREMQLHIDEDVFSTFYHFTKADIFVHGQGSFSLLANYLCDGIKLVTPWHTLWRNFPSDIYDLISVNPDSTFDKNKILKAMEKDGA